MNQEEIKNWLQVDKINLNISKEYYHHHAYEILNAHSKIKTMFNNSLGKQIKITPRVKKTKSNESLAIKAEDLNVAIRNLLKEIPNNEIKFEVFEENGVFYFSSERSSIGGFDFAILNHYSNIEALRNLCFGNLQYADGEARWERFLAKNPDLVSIANKLKQVEKKGRNIESNETIKPSPLIVGEIQFGNWALAYRDFFKVLKADVQNSVDCLIYIVPTGKLEALLSDGIVTFDKTQKILKEFSKVITVPVWLVGLDVE